MIESGSFKVIGGAAKDTYKLYTMLARGKGYSIDLHGNFSKIGNAAKTVNRTELMSKDYDIVWLNSIRDVTIADEYRKRHPGSGTKFLYVDRGNVLLNFRNSRLKKLLPKMVARRYLISRLARWLDCYVAITPEQYDYARSFFSGKVHVSYIPIAPHEEFRVLGIRRSYNGAVTVARLDERQKKLSQMIKGIAKVRDKHPELKGAELLRIVGTGVDEKRYKAMVESLGLGGNVRFEGTVYGEELIKKYNNASFFVSTSEWESPGRALLEAMACGLPLLINDKINSVIEYKPLTTIVRQDYNGLVYRYGDIDGFAKEFYSLYSNKALQKKMSVNARSFVSRFSFGRVVKGYKRIIDGI